MSKDIGISPRLSRSAFRTVSPPRRRSDFKRQSRLMIESLLQLLSAFKKGTPFPTIGKQLAARNLSVIYVIDVLHREVDFVG